MSDVFELENMALEDLKELNNQAFYKRKADEKYAERQAAYNKLCSEFGYNIGYPRQDYACLIWNTLNALTYYTVNQWTPFTPDGKLCDDFLSRIYHPFYNFNYADSTDWCTCLFYSFKADPGDHNLYFIGTLIMADQTKQVVPVLVDNFTLDVVRRVLLHNDRTDEIEKADLAVIHDKRDNWSRSRYDQFVDLLIEIKRLRLSDLPGRSTDYRYCSIVINRLYYVYEIEDGQAKLLGDADNELMRDLRFEHTAYSNNPWCLRMAVKPPFAELKADMNIVLPLLRYLTMGDKNTFDNLAKDFVHYIMIPGFKRRNTMVSGDLDKLNKWVGLINSMAYCVELSNMGPAFLDKSTAQDAIELLLNGKDYCPDKDSYIPFNTNIFTHVYYLCSKDEQPKEMDKGNKYIHLEFKYGGEYYNLTQPGQHELIWLAQLFFAHGWHLINKAEQSHKVRTRNIEKEFIERFLCKDGTYVVDGSECLNQDGTPHLIRLPLALVYELYKSYAGKEKQTKPISDTQLREMLEHTYSFSYSTQKATKTDIEYISRELRPFMDKSGINFDEKWVQPSGKKVLECTVNDEFWHALTAPSTASEAVYTEFESFDKFVNEVYSRYQNMFIYNTALLPEPQPPVFGSQYMK